MMPGQLQPLALDIFYIISICTFPSLKQLFSYIFYPFLLAKQMIYFCLSEFSVKLKVGHGCAFVYFYKSNGTVLGWGTALLLQKPVFPWQIIQHPN